MRIIVDYDLCESNALCMGVATDVFELGEDDLLRLDEKPPEGMRETVIAAAKSCRKAAITIVE
jgi:ferredoxin